MRMREKFQENLVVAWESKVGMITKGRIRFSASYGVMRIPDNEAVPLMMSTTALKIYGTHNT